MATLPVQEEEEDVAAAACGIELCATDLNEPREQHEMPIDTWWLDRFTDWLTN